jgi:AsmA protein
VRVLKWVGIIVAIVVGLVIAVLLVGPSFVDVNKYKPRIEAAVTESTGRPFSIGGDIDLSLFPWVGASLSDMHLGNAEGFKEKDFVSVEEFEVRVRLFPLLFRDLQVKRFIVKGPKIVLEKDKNGRGNWEDLVKPKEHRKPEGEGEGEPEEKPPINIKNLVVGEFALTSGELIWIDHQKDTERRLTEINLALDPISLDLETGLDLSARLDGQPIEIKGEAGPFGRPIGEGKIPVLLNIRALDALVAKVQGFLADLGSQPRFVLEMEVDPFSPRTVAEAMGVDLFDRAKDPEAFNEVSMKTTLSGTTTAVALKDGLLKLDDSTMEFDVEAKEFEKPNLTFTFDLDRMDLDRYLLLPAKDKEKKEPPSEEGEKPEKEPDFGPLRTLVMDGTVRVGELRARGATASEVQVKITAENGVIKVDPFSMNFYGGGLSGKMRLNVKQDTPRFKVTQSVKNVQTGLLLKDLGYTDRFEGLMQFKADISAAGTEPELIKKTLNGSGDFAFTDGAIVGFDIAQLARNLTAAFGLGEKKKPRTEFSELKGSFSVKDGLVDNPSTQLSSALLRVLGKGTVDLPSETINYRVEPKLVATMKGQGDAKRRPGLMVPLTISGTFSNPKFSLELGGILEDENLKAEAKKILEGFTEGNGDSEAVVTESLKLLEGLTGGEEGKGLEDLVPGLLKKKKKKK